MQLPVGHYYHRIRKEVLKITPECIEVSKKGLTDGDACFVQDDENNIFEVTEDMLVLVLSDGEAIKYLINFNILMFGHLTGNLGARGKQELEDMIVQILKCLSRFS